MPDFWIVKSQEVIAQVIAIFAVNHDLSNLSEEDKQLLRVKIDFAYPFKFKKGYPYLAWLREKRKAFLRYQLSNVGFATGTRIIAQKDLCGNGRISSVSNLYS